MTYRNRVLNLVEPWGCLVYSFRYNFRRAPSEGLQNGRFEHAGPLQMRQRVAGLKIAANGLNPAARSPAIRVDDARPVRGHSRGIAHSLGVFRYGDIS